MVVWVAENTAHSIDVNERNPTSSTTIIELSFILLPHKESYIFYPSTSAMAGSPLSPYSLLETWMPRHYSVLSIVAASSWQIMTSGYLSGKNAKYFALLILGPTLGLD